MKLTRSKKQTNKQTKEFNNIRIVIFLFPYLLINANLFINLY